MAQLPPKIPNNPTTSTSIQNPSWVDEFLDFSTSRRGTHRRSASDSIAFVEACGRGDGGHGGSSSNNVAELLRQNEGEFDRFDDENFMSMLIDDVAPSKSNNSMSSDHNNSFNDRKEKISVDRNQQNARDVVESDEVQSQCETETQTAPSTTDNATVNDRIIDPKRVKRILANRQSAQRSRVRKLQYISELERSVTSLQAEVSVLSPRVAFLDQQRLLLTVDNSALKQRIAALAQDKIFKDAHQEALKRELERLRKVFQRQNMIKPENTTSSSPTQTAAAGITVSEKEQQLLQV